MPRRRVADAHGRRREGRLVAPRAVQLGRARRGLRRAEAAEEARREGLRLDLRGNGGGLSPRRSSSRASSCQDGTIVTTRARASPRAPSTRPATPSSPTRPARRARRPGHGLGVGDRHRRAAGPQPGEVVGTQTFGKGVFQEVIELSNGGALDITAGQYFTPSGRNLGGRRRPDRNGYQAGRQGVRRPARPKAATRRSTTRARRASLARASARAGRRRPRRAAAGAGRAARRAPSSPRVVLLERRGRFLIGEPFFERGRRVTSTASRDARPGDLVLLRRRARARGTRGSPRVIGTPDVARDVLEALMLDRGLRAPLPARRRARRREARDAGGRRRRRRARARPAPLTTFTIDPATARDFDDAISAEALGDGRWRIWVHIADVSAYVRPGLARRPRGLPPRDERLRPGRGRADAARGAVQRRLLAAPRRRPPRGHRRARAARRRGASAAPSPLADPLRRAAGLRPRSTASSPARRRPQAPWAAPLAAARAAAAALQAARERARRAGDRVAPSPSSPSTRAGT